MNKIALLLSDKNYAIFNGHLSKNIDLILYDPGYELNHNYKLCFIDDSLAVSFETKIPFYSLGGLSKSQYCLGQINLNNAINEITNIYNLFCYLDKESINIDNILQNQIEIYQQVKNVHKKFVPLREHSHKGLKLFSKYMVGRSNGGEYYTVDTANDKLYIFQSTSNSYIINSLLISFSTSLSRFSEPRDFIKGYIEFLSENLSSDAEIKNIDFLWMVIDIPTLNASIYKYGKGLVYINSKLVVLNEIKIEDFEDNKLQNNILVNNINFNRDDSFIYLSTGVVDTISELNEEININKLINQKYENERNFFEELFFKLCKDGQEEFLTHDSICLKLEVNSNVIHQV